VGGGDPSGSVVGPPAGLQIVRREFYREGFSGKIFRRGQLSASRILIEPDAAVMSKR